MRCNRLLGFVAISIALKLVSTVIYSYLPEHDYSVMSKHIEQITNSDSRILLAHNIENDINSFLLQSRSPLLLVNLNKNLNTETITEKYDIFIIIIKHVKDFYYFLDLFTLSEAWNNEGKYLVFFVGNGQIDDIFQISWKNYIINIDIFLWNNNEMQVYTYFPYKGNNCAENITAELLGKHTVENLFPNKLPLNFNGCPIKILVDKFEPCTMLDDFATDDSTKVGFETVLLRNVLLRMNLTPSTVLTNGTLLGTKLPNGEFDGLLRYLQNGEREIIVGHLWPKPPFYFEYFGVSYPYFQDYVYWYVPSATRGARWESLYLIFTVTMWLSILAMYMLNLLVWVTFTRRIYYDGNETKSFGWCALETWRSLLQGSFKMPKSAIMKILVITWSVGGFILAAAYQSQLLSILTSPIYNHQISTLEELADSTFPIPYAGYALDTYKNSSIDVERRILAKAQIYSLPEFIDYVTSHVGSVAYVASAIRCRYNQQLDNYFNSDGRSKLYEIRKAALTNYVCMYTMRGYPLLPRINSNVLLYLENGLFYKWVKDVNSMPHVKSNKEQERLGINHLKGIFGLWLLGLLLSALAFIIETLMSKKQINK